MQRRKLLRRCGLSLAVALAGCTGQVRWYVEDQRPESNYVEKVLVGASEKHPLQSYVYLVVILQAPARKRFPITFRIQGPDDTVPGHTARANRAKRQIEVSTTWEAGSHDLVVSRNGTVLERIQIELRKREY